MLKKVQNRSLVSHDTMNIEYNQNVNLKHTESPYGTKNDYCLLSSKISDYNSIHI